MAVQSKVTKLAAVRDLFDHLHPPGRAGTMEAPGLGAVVIRYDRALQPALWGMSRRHARFSDLLGSFPAAAIALATLRGDPAARGEALGRIAEGHALPSIAEALDLSLWLKRFTPEQLGSHIPDCFTFAGPQPGFNAAIARRVPHADEAAANWLVNIAEMLQRGPASCALWAGSSKFQNVICRSSIGRILPVYAFYGERPESLAGQLVECRPSGNQSLTSVLKGMSDWMKQIIFDHAIDPKGIPDVLVLPSLYRGATVTPICDPRSLRSQARQLNNCLDRYVSKVLHGQCRIFRMDLPVTEETVIFEVECRRGNPPVLCQIAGPSNVAPSRRACHAVHAFFTDVLTSVAAELSVRLQVDPETWQLLWEAYWQVYGTGAGIPQHPCHADLVGLALTGPL